METIITGDNSLAELPEQIDLVYADPPFNTGTDFAAFDDRWDSTTAYLNYVGPRLERCWDHLRDGGNMIVHVDWRVVHYLKVYIDRFAGAANFHNEIIWSYNSGGASKQHLSRKHDTLLWWAKGPHYPFNVQREPYATPDVADRPGFHPEGRMLTDVWAIPFISTTGKERTGYPTQRPVALLDRIVAIFSNPGDLVVDPFCGSGTTGVAAKRAGRHCWLIDINPEATEVTGRRLAETVAPDD